MSSISAMIITNMRISLTEVRYLVKLVPQDYIIPYKTEFDHNLCKRGSNTKMYSIDENGHP